MKLTITIPPEYVAAIREKLATQTGRAGAPQTEAEYVAQILKTDVQAVAQSLVASAQKGITVAVEPAAA